MKTAIKALTIIHLICAIISSLCPFFWVLSIPWIILDAVTLKRLGHGMKGKVGIAVSDFIFMNWLVGLLLLLYKEEKPKSYEEEKPMSYKEPVSSASYEETNNQSIQATQNQVYTPKRKYGAVSIVSIVLGSVALASMFASYIPMIGQLLALFTPFSIFLAIAGIVCGAIAKKKHGKKAGLVISIIATVYIVVYTVFTIVLFFVICALGLLPQLLSILAYIPFFAEYIEELMAILEEIFGEGTYYYIASVIGNIRCFL